MAIAGIWDDDTRDELIGFQRDERIKVDGVLFPEGESERKINERQGARPADRRGVR